MITVFDLEKLYKTYFGNPPYYVDDFYTTENRKTEEVVYGGIKQNPRPKGTVVYAKQIPLNKVGFYGQDIWHPVTFWWTTLKQIEIEACTIRVNSVKQIIRTQVSERKGSVKEQFSIGDYKFTIKGFLIGKNRQFPQAQIELLKELYETSMPVQLYGGYPELFLAESPRVVIDSLEFPEVEGKNYWIRPFSLTCESDFIQDLIIP